MGFYNVVNAPALVAGQPEDISQVLANFQAIAAVLNGGLDNSNVSGAAAIDRSKLNFGAGLVNNDIAVAASIALTKLAAPAFTPYVPVWTAFGVAPVLGNGALIGKYYQIAKLVVASLSLNPGSTTTYGTGGWLFTLPVPITSLASGYGYAYDASAGLVLPVSSSISDSTHVVVWSSTGPQVYAAAPFTWAISDALQLNWVYETT